MPQLTSGRHVALLIEPFWSALKSADASLRLFAAIALRAYAATAAELLRETGIAYYETDQGTPPHAPSYYSGLCVADVLDGHPDWSPGEVRDFRAYTREARVTEWMQQHFDQLQEYSGSILTPEVLDKIADHDDTSADKLKLAVIFNSALAPDAMAQLRKPRMVTEANSNLMAQDQST